MLGAIAGDVIGSVYEGRRTVAKDFPLFHPKCEFTDDTVMTVAVAEALQTDGDYAKHLRDWGTRYPNRGYGLMFSRWLKDESTGPYNSFGNGSAMRCSPAAWAFGDLPSVLSEAKRTADVSHNHPEGVKGAQAVAAAIWLARHGSSKEAIRNRVEDFGYSCRTSLAQFRATIGFDETCQGTVPPAVVAFLDSTDFEDAIRNAVSLGGDTDTLACIAGSIAEPFYGGVPPEISKRVWNLLDDDVRRVVVDFRTFYKIP